MHYDLIISYARVSSLAQDEGQALTQQIDRLNRAEPIHHKLYQDVQTGDDSDRPNYQLLRSEVRDATKQGLKVLVRVARLDRLSRNNHEIDQIIEEWDRLGVVFQSLDGGIYTAREAQDWLRSTQEGIYAQYFLRQLSSNIRKGKDYKRRMGRPVGMAPYGYMFNADKTKFEKHPERSRIFRILIHAYLPEPHGLGVPLSALRAIALANGWEVTESAIRYALRNPVYRGHLTAREGGITNKERKIGISKPLKIVAWCAHEPIITEQEYKLLEAQLDENRRHWGANAAKTKRHCNVLAGLCYCSACGYRLRYAHQEAGGKGSGGKIYTYIHCHYKGCVNTIRCPEGLAIAAVESEIIKQAIAFANAVVEPDEIVEAPEVTQMRAELQELQAIQSSSRIAGLLEGAIAELEVRIAAASQPGEAREHSTDYVRELARSFIAPRAWAGLSPQEKKLLYREFVDRVVILGREIVSITLLF